METINQYTIHCTEEQTEKALKLGAPIEFSDPFNDYLPHEMIDYVSERGNVVCADFVLPTAEQMIGWLEEQGVVVILVSILDGDTLSYRWVIHSCQYDDDFNDRSDMTYSRKEATLAAIDAALDYLINWTI